MKFSITNSAITVSVVQRLRNVCRPVPMNRMPAEYSHDIAHTPHSPWCTRWNSGPAKAVPIRLTARETPATSAALTRIRSAAPAAPRTATEP